MNNQRWFSRSCARIALASAFSTMAAATLLGGPVTAADSIDLSTAEICPASPETLERNAAAMLRDEIATRTRVHLPSCAGGPASNRVTIRIGTAETLPSALESLPSEPVVS